MLLHGPAGCGKSTAARKIEEFLWLDYKENWLNRQWEQTVRSDKPLIPIFISLPSLKDPL